MTQVILYVDDNTCTLEYCASWLCDAGYEVIVAETISRAIELILVEDKFDLIISDVVFVGVQGADYDGIRLARWCQSTVPEIPVVLRSHMNLSNILDECIGLTNVVAFSPAQDVEGFIPMVQQALART